MPPPRLPSSREIVTQLLNALRAHPRASGDPANAAAVTDPFTDAARPFKKQLIALHVLFPNELLPALDLLDRRLVARYRICPVHDRQPDEQTPLTQSIASRHSHGLNIEGAMTQSHELAAHSPEVSRCTAALTHTTQEAASAEVGMTEAPRIEALATFSHMLEENQDTIPQVDSALQPMVNIDTIYYVRSAQQRPSRFSTSYDATTSYEVRLKAWNCSCPAFAFSAFSPIHSEPPIPTYVSAKSSSARPATKATTSSDDSWNFGGMSLGDGPAPVCKHLLACVLVERCATLFGAFVEERDVTLEEAAGWGAGWGD